MGQANAKRIQWKSQHANITSALNDTRQETPFTGYFQLGDIVDVVEMDAAKNILSTLSDNNTVAAIEKDVAITLGTTVDTSVPPNGGTYYITCQNIDDVQEAVDRLYHRGNSSEDLTCDFDLPIVAQFLNSPIGGQTKYEVSDVKGLQAGDSVQILDAAPAGGLIGTGTVISVNIAADEANNKSEIVISTLVDTSTATTPVIHSVGVTIKDCLERLSGRIDSIDDPIENEDEGLGNGTDCAFETSNLFLQGTSKVYLDGIRKKKGTAGTRASLAQGAGDSALTFTSMLMGLLGNEIRVKVQAGAGFAITVVKSYQANSNQIVSAGTDYLITINDNTGAATSQEIADALNAHAQVKRILMAQWGGDGTGVVAAFGPTALTGGLDNGAGDYAELPQIFENVISLTGYKWISFHLRPNERNRMSIPPEDDEEITMDYRMASVNA